MDENDIQKALDYIETHLCEEIDYAEVAKRAYSSSYHFQRVFGILFGITLGDYIRRRRLSLAAKELLCGEKVLDVAVKYGYNTSESFSRSFFRYMGKLPSQVKKLKEVKVFNRFDLNFEHKRELIMDYKIEERPEMILTGFKKRFFGAPDGPERITQENEFYCETRGQQWLLLGASNNFNAEYAVITDIDDNGYDYYIAYELSDWTRKALSDPKIIGFDTENMNFEQIFLPKRLCAVFSTERSKHPIENYGKLRQRSVVEWLKTSDYQFDEAPEVIEIHWQRGQKQNESRFIEITLPLKKQ